MGLAPSCGNGTYRRLPGEGWKRLPYERRRAFVTCSRKLWTIPANRWPDPVAQSDGRKHLMMKATSGSQLAAMLEPVRLGAHSQGNGLKTRVQGNGLKLRAVDAGL